MYVSDLVVHAYNPSTQEAETGGLRAQGQPGQHSKILFLKKERERERERETEGDRDIEKV
jgi:hypothetical protein